MDPCVKHEDDSCGRVGDKGGARMTVDSGRWQDRGCENDKVGVRMAI
jgi:hypothetical protein